MSRSRAVDVREKRREVFSKSAFNRVIEAVQGHFNLLCA